MTSFASYGAPIHEAWATWEILRKLGFKADDIFWEVRNTLNAIPVPGPALTVILRTQGAEMSVTCSHRLSAADSRRVLKRARDFQIALAAGTFDEAEMTAALRASYAWTHQAGLVLVLRAKGIDLPYRNQQRN